MKYAPYIRIIENADTAVLMVHGIVGSPDHFKELIPLIPEDWSIYNILLDGHGKDVEDFSHTSMAKWKTQVHNQLEQILQTHRRVLMVAHSMGTLFAIQEAIASPGKIASLFLLNVPLVPYVHPKVAANSVYLALGKPKNNATARAMQAGTSIHLSPKLWKYVGWAPRYWELLVECRATLRSIPKLTTPTLTFHSRHDELVTSHTCKYLRNHPYITNIMLESSGHFAYSRIDTHILKSKLKKTIEDMQ